MIHIGRPGELIAVALVSRFPFVSSKGFLTDMSACLCHDTEVVSSGNIHLWKLSFIHVSTNFYNLWVQFELHSSTNPTILKTFQSLSFSPICSYQHICVNICMCLGIYVRVCVSLCVRACVCMCVCVCDYVFNVCVYMYICINICICDRFLKYACCCL